MSVSVTFVVEGRKIKITRQWHFHFNGRHRPNDEEVRILDGDQPVRVGRLEDKKEFFSNYIAKTFIPYWLAPFFLFDGEQVQRLANQDMATQVRTGVEGLLGIGTLRELRDDLNSYATTRRGNTDLSGSNTLQTLSEDLQALELQIAQQKRECDSIQPRLGQLAVAKESKMRSLRSVAGGNKANMEELYTRKSQAEAQQIMLREHLADFLQTDLALIVAGNSLRTSTLNQLRGEAVREKWEAGKREGQARLSTFGEKIQERRFEAKPPLDEAQFEWLKRAIEESWEALWYPPPSDCAGYYLHNSLVGRERDHAITALERIDSVALGDLQQLLSDQRSAEQEVALVDSRIREMGGVTAEVERLTEEMKRLQEEESGLNRSLEEAKRSIEGLSSQLSSKRADYERVREQQDRSQPVMARVLRAERIANMLDTLIQEMYPLKVKEVADAMTLTYKSLAHKTLLDRIQISDDCQVSLLDRQGNDIRRFDPSAGENQIFAISLISAIAQVSEMEIPMVVDTPLARLDEKHRLNVLTHWAGQPGQVILLSATDEVAGRYYDSIKDRISAVYHLTFEELETGIGNTHVNSGYWRKS